MSTKHIPYVTVSLFILMLLASHPSTFCLGILPYQSIHHRLNQSEVEGEVQDRSRNICGETLWLLQEWIEWHKGYQKSLYIFFLLRPAVIVIHEIRVLHLFHYSWILAIALFVGIASLTAYIKPYRKSYMNILDTLLLLHIALLCLLISTSFNRSTVFKAICEILLFTVPLIIFLLSVIVKSAINFKHFPFPKNCLCYKHCQSGDGAEAYILR